MASSHELQPFPGTISHWLTQSRTICALMGLLRGALHLMIQESREGEQPDLVFLRLLRPGRIWGRARRVPQAWLPSTGQSLWGSSCPEWQSWPRHPLLALNRLPEAPASRTYADRPSCTINIQTLKQGVPDRGAHTQTFMLSSTVANLCAASGMSCMPSLDRVNCGASLQCTVGRKTQAAIGQGVCGLHKGLSVKVDGAVDTVRHAVVVYLVDVVCDLWYKI